jgi:hypothetical protein
MFQGDEWMLATFSDKNIDEMLALTNGHLDHLSYVAKYIRFKNPSKRVTPKTVKQALAELEGEGYAPPPAKRDAVPEVTEGV